MSNNLHADTQIFSCGVCFDEYPVAEKVLCGFDGCEAERHSFCQKCVVSHAKASTVEVQLAEGGFRCMEHGCTNSILYSVAIQKLLPQNVKERLDERIMEEDLAKSGLVLERCRDCNYAMEMEQSKEENMIFPCLKCRKKWCRICGREWNHEHVNVTCAQLDAKNNTEKKQRELESKLNEAIIRKCECGLHFTKDDGCNKMTCRCGLTQCYICREKNIDYNHFCQHVREPGITACPCGKKCTIWIDANKVDQVVIDRIYAESAENGINLNNGGKQEEQHAATKPQQNPNVMEYFQEVYRYANRQIRDAAIQAEQQRLQTLLQALNQAEQQKQQALLQSEQQRKQALYQAAQQRKQALRQAEQQRQQNLYQADLCRNQAEQQRQQALRQAEQQPQQALYQPALWQQQPEQQVLYQDALRQQKLERRRQKALYKAEQRRQKAAFEAARRQQKAERKRQKAVLRAQWWQRKAEKRRQKAEQQRQQNAVRDEQLRQAFQQMGLRIQEGFRRIERGIQNFFNPRL